MIISFISPIFNEEDYIHKLLEKIDLFYNDYDFEWIFIDDNSSDKSLEIIKNFSKNKYKIHLIKNTGKGKIDAINNGFKIAKGNFIKLVAGDDEIDLSFIKYIEKHDDGKTSFVHNGKIIDENYNVLGNYIPPYQIFNYDLDNYLLNNISCPSWCWIFPREQANKFFPIPKCEYEDLYLSFCLKKFTKIQYIKKFFYIFKQNKGQTFGNVLKFNNEIGNYRSKRSLKSLSIIKNCKIFSVRERFLISKSRLYFILYLKKKNIFNVFFSDLPIQRKLKHLIFRYFFKFYKFFQNIKYSIDRNYHIIFKSKKIHKNSIQKVNFEKDIIGEIKNKKVIFLKSCLDFPTSDGLTIQYYDFINYLCSKNEHLGIFFCKKNFNSNNFKNKYKNIKNIKFEKKYKSQFSQLIIELIYLVLLHKLGIKKNSIFLELETFSKNTDYSFYLHDISLYPLLFLNIEKKRIIFSLTDLQINRIFKLIFLKKNIKNFFYYFFGLIHCLIIEPFFFKKIKYLHVYSKRDEQILKKILFNKNTISIPNYNTFERNIESNEDFSINNEKILIMGDLNNSEIFDGIQKLHNLKYFSKFEKNYTFQIKGDYSEKLKLKIRKIFSNIEFNNIWVDDINYINFLDSFKILLFIDSVDFGLSNRVANALKAKTLTVGFKKAFTGYNLKNYEQVIFIKNFFDFVYASRIDYEREKKIIENANKFSKNYNLSVVKDKWNSIL